MAKSHNETERPANPAEPRSGKPPTLVELLRKVGVPVQEVTNTGSSWVLPGGPPSAGAGAPRSRRPPPKD